MHKDSQAINAQLVHTIVEGALWFDRLDDRLADWGSRRHLGVVREGSKALGSPINALNGGEIMKDVHSLL